MGLGVECGYRVMPPRGTFHVLAGGSREITARTFPCSFGYVFCVVLDMYESTEVFGWQSRLGGGIIHCIKPL